MQDILNKKEELHPDLVKYMTKHDTLNFDMIQHPLVYSIMHSEQLNALVNKQYEQKLKSIEEAIKEKDYTSYIWLHERPYRLQAFVSVLDNITPKEYWEGLSSIWTDSENIWQNKKIWKGLLSLSEKQDTKHLFMSESDLKTYNELPNEFKVYRGYIIDQNENGFSYTLNKEKAEWFSKRFHKNGSVLERTVKKEDIFAYTNERGEQEVIILK